MKNLFEDRLEFLNSLKEFGLNEESARKVANSARKLFKNQEPEEDYGCVEFYEPDEVEIKTEKLKELEKILKERPYLKEIIEIRKKEIIRGGATFYIKINRS